MSKKLATLLLLLVGCSTTPANPPVVQVTVVAQTPVETVGIEAPQPTKEPGLVKISADTRRIRHKSNRGFWYTCRVVSFSDPDTGIVEININSVTNVYVFAWVYAHWSKTNEPEYDVTEEVKLTPESDQVSPKYLKWRAADFNKKRETHKNEYPDYIEIHLAPQFDNQDITLLANAVNGGGYFYPKDQAVTVK
jgi:hypothetical protein